jgi:1,4-dihydroxy-2-naphthoate octaprenyltransferase
MKNSNPDDPTLGKEYGKFVSTRMCMIVLVYTLALIIAYFIPAYTSNPYLIRGLPLGMLFSASFMTAGILQIPLQLFWKMEQVSIALICARVGQLALL